MQQLGGKDLSGIGFGLGVDRTLLALKAEGKTVGGTARVDVFGVPLGEQAKVKLAVLAARLRAAGVRVDLSYGDRGVKGAMRAADRSGASIALVAGDRDIEAGTIGVKNLATGEQVDVPVDAVLAEVLSRLSRACLPSPRGLAPRERHPGQHAVAQRQRVQQHRADVRGDDGNQRVRQHRMSLAEYEIQVGVERCDAGQPQRPEDDHRLAGGRHHRPADQRLRQHQRVQRQLGAHDQFVLDPADGVGQSRHAVGEPVGDPHHNDSENHHAERHVDDPTATHRSRPSSPSRTR